MVSSTPRPHFTPRKDPVPIIQEAGWTPEPVWTGGKSRPHRDSIPDRPARSQSLYRLSCSAHIFMYACMYVCVCVYMCVCVCIYIYIYIYGNCFDLFIPLQNCHGSITCACTSVCTCVPAQRNGLGVVICFQMLS